MEIKLNEPFPEKDYILYNDSTGTFYRTTLEKLDLAQKRLNEILNDRGYVSYAELFGILTEDWAPELKLQFLIDRTHGWARSVGQVNHEFKQRWQNMEDGSIIIHFDCFPKEEAPE